MPWMGGTEMTFLSSSASTAAPPATTETLVMAVAAVVAAVVVVVVVEAPCPPSSPVGGLGAEYRSCGVVFVADDAASPADLLLKAF